MRFLLPRDNIINFLSDAVEVYQKTKKETDARNFRLFSVQSIH